jgi:enamine deaminase RidA (YjgF/YER057c/UK114 family)
VKTSRNPAEVAAPGAAYAHQIEVSGTQRWLVLSGQLGQQPDGTVPADPYEQAEAALANLGANLAAAGMAVTDLVKLTIYLVGDWDQPRRRAVFDGFFGDHRPCMTLLSVAGLVAPAFRIELDAWACADS